MIKFLKSFVENRGAWVSLAMMISKVSLFLLTLIVAKILPKEEFGTVTQAINFLGFFLPISGMGSFQGLLRFGAMLEHQEEKDRLFRYSLFRGFVGQILITLAMYLIAILVFPHQEHIVQIIIAFGIRFFGMFLIELQKVKFRNEFQNDKFAILEVVHSILTFILGIIGCYLWGMGGYILSLCLSPFVVLVFLSSFRGSSVWRFKQFGLKEFWKYSIVAGITYQISSWIFMLDILFIGLLLNEEAVAEYRVSSIIPMNLFIFANIFIQTDYPKLCKYHLDKTYIFDYIKNYLKIMLLVSGFILIMGWLMAPLVLSFFGKDYIGATVFRILLLAAVSGILFRSLFGILLSVIGRVQWSFYISVVSVGLFSVGLYVFIPIFGLEGAAWACTINMLLVGIVSAVVFFVQYRRLALY